MEKFKETLKKRIWIIEIYNILVLVLITLGIFDITKSSNDHINDMISGYDLGLCVGIQLVLIYHMSKYMKALKDASLLEELYISENDERSKYIKEKIGGKSLNVVIFGLLLATMVSGFFNDIVFFTLVGTSLFTLVVKFVFKVYYNKQY